MLVSELKEKYPKIYSLYVEECRLQGHNPANEDQHISKWDPSKNLGFCWSRSLKKFKLTEAEASDFWQRIALKRVNDPCVQQFLETIDIYKKSGDLIFSMLLL